MNHCSAPASNVLSSRNRRTAAPRGFATCSVLAALVIAVFGLSGCNFDDKREYAHYTNKEVPDVITVPSFTVLKQGDIEKGDTEFIIMPGPEVAEVTGTDPESGELTELPDGSFRYVWTGTWTGDTREYEAPIHFSDDSGQSRVFRLSLYQDPLHYRSWHYRNTGTFPEDQHAPGLPGFDLGLWRAALLRDQKGDPLTGKGVTTVVFDTAADAVHEDLRDGLVSFPDVSPAMAPVFSYRNPDGAYLDSNEEMFQHGTAVAGIVGARAGNGRGSRGIAPDAEMVSVFFPELSYYQSLKHGLSFTAFSEVNILEELLRHRDSFRVINESWSMTGATRVTAAGLMALEALAEAGVSVSSSPGNSYNQNTYTVEVKELTGNGPITLVGPCRSFGINCGFNPGGHNGVSPHVIRSGAVTASGTISSYSPLSFGIWISAPGGEYGYQDRERAVVTADVSGAGAGFANRVSRKNRTDYTLFNRTLSPDNINGNSTDIMNGTSAAAAMTSGLLTLMYQAYPDLNVWQARYLLAETARNDQDFPEMAEGPQETGTLGINLRRHYERGPMLVWQPGWITNAAGYRYHGRYGFGIPDAEALLKRTLSCDTDPECQVRAAPPEAGETGQVSCRAAAPLFMGAFGNTYECELTALRDESGSPIKGEISLETAGFSIDALKFAVSPPPDAEAELPDAGEISRELRDRAVLDPKLFCRDATMYFAETQNGAITPDKYQQKLPLQLELYSPAGTPGIIKNYWSNFMGIRGYRDKKGVIRPYSSRLGDYVFRSMSFYGERVSDPENAVFRTRFHSFCPLDLAYIEQHLQVSFDYYRR